MTTAELRKQLKTIEQETTVFKIADGNWHIKVHHKIKDVKARLRDLGLEVIGDTIIINKRDGDWWYAFLVYE